MSGSATDADILEALSKRATKDIMEKVKSDEGTHPGLKSGEYPLGEITDTDILNMEKALRPLQAKQRAGHNLDRDAFDREARQRFEEVGFVIDVKWWYRALPNCFIPECEPYARSAPVITDYDKQVHDVTADILGLGTKGVLSKGTTLGQHAANCGCCHGKKRR